MGVLKTTQRRAWRFLVEESGPTATEYAVMLALIIVICLVSIGALGRTVNGMYQATEAQISTAVAQQ